MGAGGDVQTLLEAEPLRSKDRGLFTYNIEYIYIIYICIYISTTVYIYIDYSAAFDTESQLFLDSALAETGVSSKVRRIVQAIFAAATGVVRIRQQDGWGR